MDRKEFYQTFVAANWCIECGICTDDKGTKCPFYLDKRNCTETFAKFIIKYEKIIRENTKFCDHCGALIEEGDNDE